MSSKTPLVLGNIGTQTGVAIEPDQPRRRAVKLERSNVEFPIWRKKVDLSLFEENGTTIPNWACRMWNLRELYGTVASRKDKSAAATVTFNRVSYDASVTSASKGRATPAIRLWYDPALSLELKRAFLMSYMRCLEGSTSVDVEKTIPFWEFLELEFDEQNRAFPFVAYYTQSPSFPNLFQRLIGSPSLAVVHDELDGKGESRIQKGDWKHRVEVEFELGARNVIYTR